MNWTYCRLIMATISSRLSGVGDNVFTDQEKDSNALLLELDKGSNWLKFGLFTVYLITFNCFSCCMCDNICVYISSLLTAYISYCRPNSQILLGKSDIMVICTTELQINLQICKVNNLFLHAICLILYSLPCKCFIGSLIIYFYVVLYYYVPFTPS